MPEAPPLAKDSRRFRRFPIDGSVRLYSSQAVRETPLVDISLKGLLVERPSDWPSEPGRGYRAEVRLDGGVIISMAVSTAHCTEDHVGFRCERIDMDSFTRLRRLVELNLGASELLNRELEALG